MSSRYGMCATNNKICESLEGTLSPQSPELEVKRSIYFNISPCQDDTLYGSALLCSIKSSIKLTVLMMVLRHNHHLYYSIISTVNTQSQMYRQGFIAVRSCSDQMASFRELFRVSAPTQEFDSHHIIPKKPAQRESNSDRLTIVVRLGRAVYR